MALKNDRYTYRVTWSEDDNEYVGLCAEFPSLSWLAKKPEVALKGIRKLVRDVVKDMEGKAKPSPTQSLAGITVVNSWYEFLPKFTESLQSRQPNLESA